MESPVYSSKGEKTGNITLPENIFSVRWNADLVKQVVDSTLSSRRKPVAHTKDRSEVRGGGRKPWKQKGTGRARHGSIRSPIWVGGGVTHGPRKDKNYLRIVTKKMKAKALFTILSRKLRDGEILFVDSLSFPEPKTKEAVKVLTALSGIEGFENLLSKKRNAALIATSNKNRETERSFGNLSNMEVVEARNLDLVALLKYKYLVLENPQEAFKNLPGKKLAEKKSATRDKQPARADKELSTAGSRS